MSQLLKDKESQRTDVFLLLRKGEDLWAQTNLFQLMMTEITGHMSGTKITSSLWIMIPSSVSPFKYAVLYSL